MVFAVERKDMQWYRSGHNEHDWKSNRFHSRPSPQPLEITGFSGVFYAPRGADFYVFSTLCPWFAKAPASSN